MVTVQFYLTNEEYSWVNAEAQKANVSPTKFLSHLVSQARLGQSLAPALKTWPSILDYIQRIEATNPSRTLRPADVIDQAVHSFLRTTSILYGDSETDFSQSKDL